jgi:hypothetical protein
MTIIIAIVLLIVGIYSGAQWGRINYWDIKGLIHDDEEEGLNERAFQFGLCAIIALGLAGLMFK